MKTTFKKMGKKVVTAIIALALGILCLGDFVAEHQVLASTDTNSTSQLHSVNLPGYVPLERIEGRYFAEGRPYTGWAVSGVWPGWEFYYFENGEPVAQRTGRQIGAYSGDYSFLLMLDENLTFEFNNATGRLNRVLIENGSPYQGEFKIKHREFTMSLPFVGFANRKYASCYDLNTDKDGKPMYGPYGIAIGLPEPIFDAIL